MSGLPTEQAKAENRSPVGMYVHVPFCSSTCDFCAFYQKQPTAAEVKQFLAVVQMEAALVEWPPAVSTIFWGGGTPGLLAPRDLAALAEVTRERAGGAPAEWTVELAPSSVTADRLAVLRDAGVTRVSLGIQSFVPELLDALGRQHTREQVYRAYERVRSAGFPSVNIDLMFALPGQSEAEWLGDLTAAIALKPDHISTYCLTFEEDTKLWLKLSQGRVKLDPDHEARLYETTWDRLAEAGYGQYEVSNFARPGHECRHNINTWRMHEWVGLGPSAASQHAAWRGRNVADLERWAGDVQSGRRATEDRVALTPGLLAEDALIFGLRMNDGVEVDAWRKRVPDLRWSEVIQMLDQFATEGLLDSGGGRTRLTRRGRLVADAIGAELLGAFSGESAASPSVSGAE